MEQKPLATEIVNDMQNKIDYILLECDSLILDLGKAHFILSELLEMVDKEPNSKEEILFFANNQLRISSYTEIAFDYVSLVKSDLQDMIIRAERTEPEGGRGNNKEED